jgi:uncharacterized protein
MRALLFVALATMSAQCSRAPAEEFSVKATGAGPSATVTVPPPAASGATVGAPAAGRCIAPTPAQPPPAVPRGPAPGCPPDPESGLPEPPRVNIAFPDAGHSVTVEAEFVTSPHDTERGLMYRKSMAEEHGMLFRLATRTDQEFWMHNTCIPLDLLYVDEDGLIVGIVENAPTLNDAPRGVGCPSRYVLEVNAGWSRKHGVKAGQRMTLPPETK